MQRGREARKSLVKSRSNFQRAFGPRREGGRLSASLSCWQIRGHITAGREYRFRTGGFARADGGWCAPFLCQGKPALKSPHPCRKLVSRLW
jgi:hypothetical protein